MSSIKSTLTASKNLQHKSMRTSSVSSSSISSLSKRRLSSSSSTSIKLSAIGGAKSLPIEKSVLSLKLAKKSGEIEEEEEEEESEVEDEVVGSEGATKTRKKYKKSDTIFKCEVCSKAYRHPQCLIKHRWEHTSHFKETSNLSKHQLHQMFEAATILSIPANFLPQDKNLWPAAVSPPHSGLLGSETFNSQTLSCSHSYSTNGLNSFSSLTRISPQFQGKLKSESPETDEAEFSLDNGPNGEIDQFGMDLETEEGNESNHQPPMFYFEEKGNHVVKSDVEVFSSNGLGNRMEIDS